MTLNQLRKSLAKFNSSDFSNMEIIVIGLDENNKKTYDVLTFVGLSNNAGVIFLGGQKITQQLLAEGVPGVDGKPFKIKPPDDEIEPGEEWKRN